MFSHYWWNHLIHFTFVSYLSSRRYKHPLAMKTWLKLAVIFSGSSVISLLVINDLLQLFSFNFYIPK
jgi:hypothetical protein